LLTSSASATLQEQVDVQYSSYGGGVTYDALGSNSGTEFPIGTPRVPCNDLEDVLTIVQTRGFRDIFIRGDAIIDSGLLDYTGLTFVGESSARTTITISSDANVTNCQYKNATVTGILDGESTIENCQIGTLSFVNGVVQDSILLNVTVTLGGGNAALFVNCSDGTVGTPVPIIDMGGSGQQLVLSNYSGGIELINKSGTDSVDISLNGGRIFLNNTVDNGTILLSGTGNWANRDTYTGNATIINHLIDGLLVQQIEGISFNGGVTIDVIDGESGTNYPIGTAAHPTNSVSNALTIAEIHGLHKLYVHGDLTIGATDNVSNYHIFGFGATLNVFSSTFTLVSGCVTMATFFYHACITGVQGGECNFIECIIDELSSSHCHFKDTGFKSKTAPDFTIQHNNAGWTSNHVTDLHNCYGDHNQIIVDRNGTALNQVWINFAGRIKFINQNRVGGVAIVHLHMNSGEVEIDSSCTTGVFFVSGNCEVVNNTGGSTVTTIGVLAKVAKVDEIHKLHGLDPDAPLVVTSTSRTAGVDITQDIEEVDGTVTVTRI
jgi:hypothetical protein